MAVTEVNSSLREPDPPSSKVNPPSSKINPPSSKINPPSSKITPPSSKINPPTSTIDPGESNSPSQKSTSAPQTVDPLSQKIDLPSKKVDKVIDKENDQDSDKETPSNNPFIGNTTKKRPSADKIVPLKRQKKAKMSDPTPGGYAPTYKPITVDLDREDQIIVTMKQTGYSSEAIAERLVELGLTRYEANSITCRYTRIRKKAHEYEERLLDEELTDWHEDEDEHLAAAFEAAQFKREAEIEKLEEKVWSWTAQELNKRAPRARFSAKACRERHEAIESGTARVPPERDPDPEGRAREREERLAAFKLRRQEEAKKEVAEKKKKQSENSASKIAAKERKETRTKLRTQKQQEEEEFRRTKREATAAARKRKQNIVNFARSQRRYDGLKQKHFKKLHTQLRKEAALRKKMKKSQAATAEEDGSGEHYVQRSRYAYQNTAEQIEDEDFSAVEAAMEARAHEFSGVVEAVGHVEPNGDMPMTKPSLPTEGLAFDHFTHEPRHMCTIDELWEHLRARGMLLNRMKEAKPVILSRLNVFDEALPIEELRDMLTQRGEETTGTKAELVRLLAIADAKTSRKYQSKYVNRPLDEDGKRTIVKPIVQTIVPRTTKRYNARETTRIMEEGMIEPEYAPPAPEFAPPARKKKTSTNVRGKKKAAKKVSNDKGPKKPFSLSNELVTEGDDGSDGEHADNINDEDLKDVVADSLGE